METQKNMEKCSSCGSDISLQVAKFSVENYVQPLCMGCQKKVQKKGAEKKYCVECERELSIDENYCYCCPDCMDGIKGALPPQIYIGTNAGKEIENAINGAKESVDIVCPYLSSEFVEKLINCYNKGIKVCLITNDNERTRKAFLEKNANIKNIITQKRYVDCDAQKRRIKLKYQYKILLRIFFATIITLLVTLLFVRNIYVLLGLLPINALAFFVFAKKNKASIMRVYSYSYKYLFPIKFFDEYKMGVDKRVNSIHSKIYVIDKKIAYLGSVNFTVAGMAWNYECRVEITDKENISIILENIDNLFSNPKAIANNLSESNLIDRWKKMLFEEPINEDDKYKRTNKHRKNNFAIFKKKVSL
jgi:phosphatidylserine/phosphatidylglycerophosphate/cardiolipin synthase-like enzyme